MPGNGSGESNGDPPRPEPRATWDLLSGTRLVEAAVAQTTLLTALFFYFGWAQASANLGYFGVDVSILQLSVTDFLLRSVPVAVRPFFNAAMYVIVATAIVYICLQFTVASLARRRNRRYLIVTCAIGIIGLMVWSILFHHVVVPLPFYPLATPMFPVILGAALLLCLRSWRKHSAQRSSSIEVTLERCGIGALIALAIVGLFWHTGVVASEVGKSRAETTAAELDQRPDVAVFSATRLSLAGTGVVVDPLAGADIAYRYRYTGLRLLGHAGGRYLLVPAGWQRGRDPVYLLQEGDGIRFEFQVRP
jgi:hypothetical protein